MREFCRSASRGLRLRLLVALGLFVVSGLLAFSATFVSPLSVLGQASSNSNATRSVIWNEKLGHSYWNEIITQSARAIPSLGNDGPHQLLTMRAAAGHARTANSVKRQSTLSPMVSVAVHGTELVHQELATILADPYLAE